MFSCLFVCLLLLFFAFFLGGGGGVVFIFFLEAFVRFYELTGKGNVTALPATDKAVAIFREGTVLSPYFVRLLKARLSNKLEN